MKRYRHKWYAPALLVLCIAVLMVRQGHGFSVFSADGVTPIVWVDNGSIRYLSPSTFPLGSEAEAAILASMGLWNIIAATDFSYSYSPLDQDYPIDNFDGYNDTIAVPASELDEGVLGVTSLVNNGNVWYDMDILFNGNPLGVGYTLNPTPGCDVVTHPEPSNGFAFMLVATHELGHALGLGHDPFGDEAPGAPWFIGTMNPAYPGGGPVGQENIIELHTDDRAGLRFLYPLTGTPETPRPDLALAGYGTSTVPGLTLPLSFTPSVVFPGDELTAHSIIENFGSTSETGFEQGYYLSTDPTIDVGDVFLGSLLWDLVFEDALAFEVVTTMPDDIAAGTYYFGSIIDDTDVVAEEWEDNNAISYCEPLAVAQLTPAIEPLSSDTTVCGQSYSGQIPTVTHPLNMGPITWSFDQAPDGMTISSTTGAVQWPQPAPSTFPHTVTIRATNDAGSSTSSFFLAVQSVAPSILDIRNANVSCASYTGPTPTLTWPLCMNPISAWTLDAGPSDMTIDPSTGVVSWNEPVPSDTPYQVTIRAINTAGTDTESWQLSVVAGDLTGDGVVDSNDLPGLTTCLTGPSGGVPAGCGCGDTDADDDVDLADISNYQTAIAP